ncbi:Fic family protein [Brachybacterium huguangmaarense]
MVTDPGTTLRVPPMGGRTGRWTVPDDGLASRAARARGSGTYRAAVPARLADLSPTIPAPLAADVADAENALTRLDAHALARLGPAHAGLGPMSSILLRTESASSSQIEDLTVGARQLALAELEESTSANARLVVGNVRAMEAALALADRLDLDAILAMHRALLADDRVHGGDAGAVRSRLVWVGRTGSSPVGAAHVGPEAADVPGALEDLVAFIAREDLPVLLHAAIAHAQFETIHPFTDGNGRTGRALVHAMVRGKGLVTRTTAPISAGLLTDVGAYTDALTAFRDGDAGPVVAAFAQAARFAAVAGTGLVDVLAAELERSREALGPLRPQAAGRRLLPLLICRPVIDAAYVRAALETSPMTAQRAIAQLADAGVLVERTGRTRGRVWHHAGILEVLDAFGARYRRL